jgi:hypothetical protein
MIPPRRRRSTIATMLGVGMISLASGCTAQPPPPTVSTAAQPCPQWVEFPLDKHSGEDSPYLGCTVDFNLRAMVANPDDLEHGRALGPADGDVQSRAVEAYRQGKIKPFQGAGTTSAAPSSSAGSTAQ